MNRLLQVKLSFTVLSILEKLSLSWLVEKSLSLTECPHL